MRDVPTRRDRLVVLTAPACVTILPSPFSHAISVPQDPSIVNRTQATWSHDGRYIVWTRVSQNLVEPEAPRTEIAIEILEVHTGRILLYPVEYAPFYYSWHPDCTRLMYLSARTSLVVAYLDLFESPDLVDAKRNSTIMYRSDAFYFCYSPIPGANRVMANIPASRTAILGFTSSMNSLPLTYKEHRKDRNIPQYKSISATPPNYQPPNSSLEQEVPAESLLSFYTIPWWTSCNTMIVMVRLSKNLETLIAFDSAWDPIFRGSRPLSQVWRSEGIDGVLRATEGHSMDSEVEQHGTFALLPRGRIFKLFESTSSLAFVASPSGRYVAVYDRTQLTIIELLYEEPWKREGRKYYEVFEPKRLSGSRIVYSAPIITFALLFSPNGHSILYLTQEGAFFRWNTLNFTAKHPKRVRYQKFQQMAYLVRHYIPFFSQYTQSLQFFSPDGKKFAYPADGRIWVQNVFDPNEAQVNGNAQNHDVEHDYAATDDESEVQAPEEPIDIGEGFFCSWSSL